MSVHVTKASSLQPIAIGGSGSSSGLQTDGMTRQTAIADMCDGICASVMRAPPRSSSAVHHHGAQDTIVYAVRGHGAVVSEGGRKVQGLAPGDFALIPAWAEHQEVNDGDEELVWVVHRSGRRPEVVNLAGWEGGAGGAGAGAEEGGAEGGRGNEKK